MSDQNRKEKIAILGGGLGSMTTALALTDPDFNPGWKDKYDITLYQEGWRLGGKGASGRGDYGKIEEHGLHIWMGFYENAFEAIQKVYSEVQDVSDGCFKSWEDAFKKHSYIVLEENIDNQWKNWIFNFPENDAVPGSGDKLPSLWEYMKMTLEWMHEIFHKSKHSKIDTQKGHEHHSKVSDWIHKIAHDVKVVIDEGELVLGMKLLTILTHLVKKMDDDPSKHSSEHHGLISDILKQFIHWLKHEVKDLWDKDDESRRLLLLMDTGFTILIGLISDGVLKNPDGLNSIDDYDLQEWLKKHGAIEEVYDVQKSALLKGLYDLVFAYHNGEISKPDFAAGTALRSVFRIVFTYKGSVFWKMQAGMGDTIFTPMYLVLKNRGVKFNFFHRVRNLSLDETEKSVETIKIGRQVNLVNEDYNPLVRIEGLDCWPSWPDYDQIVDGQELKDKGYNLESFWTDWQDVEEIELKKGLDFDTVVFGISIGAVPFICSDLICANEKWKNMVDNVLSVRTLALQVWLKPDLKGLGWQGKSPVIDAYEDPFNTWADMSHLLPRESWPENHDPKNVAYFCGPMEGGIPSPQDKNVQNSEDSKVKGMGIEWLEKYAGYFWPKAASPENPKGLDFNQLVDPENRKGEERINSQYWHAAVNPSERYVLSVKGSTKYRLRAGESGFDNVVITGDWINNSFNAGCVEATVMSGLQASNAISGSPRLEDIAGHYHP
jgi:uncharacterized protein with NAD-binding domain and iron-sulfur cluster